MFPDWDYPDLRDRDGANRGLAIVVGPPGVVTFMGQSANVRLTKRCVAIHGEIHWSYDGQDGPEAPRTGA